MRLNWFLFLNGQVISVISFFFGQEKMPKPAKKCCKGCQDHKNCKTRGKCCHYCDHYNGGKCYLIEHRRQRIKEAKGLSFSDYRGDEYGMDDYEEYEEGDN